MESHGPKQKGPGTAYQNLSAIHQILMAFVTSNLPTHDKTTLHSAIDICTEPYITNATYINASAYAQWE